MSVVALVDDLMFLSRIKEAARGRSLEVKAVKTPAALLEACRNGGRVVIVDLDSRRLPGREALAALRADPALKDLPAIGFFSHVEVGRGAAGREQGCDTVLPRSAFVQRLDSLLAPFSGGPAPTA